MRTYVLTQKERKLAARYCCGGVLSEEETAKLRVLVHRIKQAKFRIADDTKLILELLAKYYKENSD